MINGINKASTLYTHAYMRHLFYITLLCTVMFGCVKRTISITSQPQGALVWVNEREVGRTPVEIDYLYYGEYDIRVEKDGQEPIMETRWPKRPLWDAPGLDLVAEMVPLSFEANTAWHFEFENRNDDPQLLLQRAQDVRESIVQVENKKIQ